MSRTLRSLRIALAIVFLSVTLIPPPVSGQTPPRGGKPSPTATPSAPTATATARATTTVVPTATRTATGGSPTSTAIVTVTPTTAATSTSTAVITTATATVSATAAGTGTPAATASAAAGTGTATATPADSTSSSKAFTVPPGQASKLSYAGATLDIGGGSVESETTLTITALDPTDLPALDTGMANVTKGLARGYRFLPHNMRFKKPIKISLPYDRTLIPAGITEQELRTYFFDDQLGKWQQLDLVEVDTRNQLVISTSDHFTDMINVALTVPDHPDPLSFNPNSLKDLKAADPGSGVRLIEPPQANNSGDARLSYPIDVPPGRVGMQPQLGLAYSSSAGNGWLGVGWDIQTPFVSIDTRWGVPRYDSASETETYILGGEQLTPLAHRDLPLEARSAQDKTFHTRVESQFRRIVRHGSGPKSYWWEVTEKDGSRSFFGGTPETGFDSAATLRDSAGNVFRWALVESRDLNRNGIRYSYDLVSHVGMSGGTVPGYQLYPKSINYTQLDGAPGAYTVTFVRDSQLPSYTPRPDVQIDARGGFKLVTAELLKRIDVSFSDGGAPQLVRRYDLEYQEGAFKKTLLKSITQRGDDGSSALPPHEFTYFDDIRTGGAYQAFDAPAAWNTGSDQVDWQTGGIAGDIAGAAAEFLGNGGASALSGAISDSVGGHIYVGFNPTAPTKQFSAGAKVGFGFSENETLLLMLDLNGDSLPDKVFKGDDGVVYFRLNESGPDGGSAFGSRLSASGISTLGRESSTTLSFGAEVYLVANALVNDAETFVTGSAYFTDVNSDGLPDLVNGGTVLFNHLQNGIPTFTPNSSDTPVPIASGSVDSNGLVEDLSALREQLIDSFPLHDTLRRWVAPFDGTVAVSGTAQLVQDAGAASYATEDGVRLAIQHEGSELWTQIIAPGDHSPKTPSNVGSIAVTAGDHIYFRVGSVFDGKFDQVSWDPIVTYLPAAVQPVLDVNGLDVFRYQASKDFTLAGRRGINVQVPFTGTLRLTGKLNKLGQTTDDVRLLVLKNGAVVDSQTAAWHETKLFSDVPDFSVQKDDVVQLRVQVDSPIDVSRLEWNPDLFYVAVTAPAGTVVEHNGKHLIQLNPPYDIDLYPESNLTAPQAAWTVPQTGRIRVLPQLTADPAATGVVTYTVKRRGPSGGDLLAKRTITIVGGAVSLPTVELDVTEGDRLYFDYSSYDPELAVKLANKTFVVQYLDDEGNPDGPPLPVPGAFHSATFPGLFPQPYRGWAAAGYNGNRARATQPIVESDLDAQFTAQSTYDPRTAKAYLFYPEPDTARWRGPDDLGYLTKNAISSSRLGVDFISVPTAASLGGAQAVSRFSRTSQVAKGFGVGFSAFNLSGSDSNGTSYGALDYLDLNGDQFPDVVGNGRVQYTTPRGGLEPTNRTIGLLSRARESDNDASNIGVGGSAAFSKGGSTGEVDTSGSGAPGEEETGSQMVTLGLGGSLGSGDSSLQFDLLDINGDGLPDRVAKNGAAGSCGVPLCVALNLGYSFAALEPWGDSPVNEGASRNLALSASIGFNGGLYDFAGGLALDKNLSHGGCTSTTLGGDCDTTARGLFDVNGDGLLDAVRASGGTLLVALSTGNGFAAETAWTGALPHGVAESANVGVGAGVYFTIGVGPLCIAACYIIINPGADLARGMARTETLIRDVDGDGYADHLFSTSDSSLTVARNRTGRTNLLKTVRRPLHATITLDYTRAGNTYDLPQSRWTLTRVALDDGLAGDGADVQLTTFAYEGGLYDRLEREFYGFARVVEEDRDAAGGGALYRSTVREYLTDSYYTKGLVKRVLTRDAAGDPFVEEANTYALANVLAPALSPNPASTTATLFPQLTRTDRRFFEGQAAPGKSTYTTQQYDPLGNVVELFDAGDTGPGDDLRATLTYTSCDAQYLVGKPQSIVVVGAGTEMRRREATVDCGTGNVTQIRQYLAGGAASTTDLTYSGAGVLTRVIGPANKNGDRYHLNYQLDPVVQTHITRVTDSFGYSSSATYNLKHGLSERAVDLNGNQTTYAYDTFGRLVTVFGPYEQVGSTPTIRYEYHPEATVPWALTRHVDIFRDPNGADTIDTVTFADGLGRVVQTKKDITLHTGPDSAAQDRMSVSGRLVFDFAGRTIKQYYPTDEPLGTPGVFNAAFDSVDPTVTEFDVLDRVTQRTLPDQSATAMRYGFGPDRSNATQFETVVTDANGIQKNSYADVRDLVTSLKEFNQGGSQVIWTSYRYDALKQLVRVEDDANNVTAITYDNLGRRTVVENPDTGMTQTVYDLASNVTEKITAVLAAKGQKITYDYDFTRLKAISYPTFPGNNVTYLYGPPGASENRAGRITQITSEAGMAERSYGKLGELTRETKTIASDTGGKPEVYTTQYLYDTWGRLQRLTYPDGELLTYDYDSGGQVRRATGQKGAFSYAYLNRLEYDEFEQKVFVEAGNGTRTQYSYEPDTRLLHNLQAKNAAGTRFQNLLYSYDNVGNVLALQNAVPVPPPSQFGGPTNQAFVYDDLYRLTSSEGVYQFAPDKTNQYRLDLAYDTIHNVLTKRQSNDIVQPSGVSVEQHKTTYDFDFDYGGSHPHAPTHIDVRTFTYDANGNQTGWTHDLNGTRRAIVWDDENRVQSIFDNGHEKQYKYDDAGVRVVKRGPQGETVYVNNSFTIRNGAIGSKHVFVGSTRLVSKLVKKNEFEKDQYFYHPDHLGSGSYITDLGGGLYEHLEYFPSGETWVEEKSNTQRTPYLFSGKELDEETGLYYYGERYYDPRVGQFISPDPLLSRGAQLLPVKPYLLAAFTYAKSNPLRFVDPTGLEPAAVTNVTVTRKTFKVPGNTLEEAIGWLQRNRPGDWGETGVMLKENPEAIRTDAKGKVVKATVDVEITVEMPEWEPPKGTGPKTKAEWERVRQALLTHEEGHVKIAQAKVKDLADRLIGKKGQAAVDLLTDIFDESKPGQIKKAFDKYDTDTEHGKKQGTTANFNIEREERRELHKQQQKGKK